MNSLRRSLAWVVILCCSALTACGGGATNPAMPSGSHGASALNGARPSATSLKIKHIIIVVQENRTFNDLFATFPGTTGSTTGYYLKGSGKHKVKTQITLQETVLQALNFNHSSSAYNYDCDGQDTYPKTSCDMDGFNLEGFNGNNPAGRHPYQYVNPQYIQPYWTIAQQFGISDMMFETQGSDSFTAHQDIIHGGSMIVDNKCGSSEPACSLIDRPSYDNWGCGAPASTTTNLLTTAGKYLFEQGPFPCLTYPDKTIRDLLDAAGVSWKYYAPKYVTGTAGAEWNAMAALSVVYNGSEWKNNVSMPQTNIFGDITSGKLAAVNWLIPTQVDSDHPHGLKVQDDGPDWIASVVNAVGASKYWNSTAIVVIWDDWGGFYDPVPPAFFDDQGGLGFRVPMLVISPYTPKGTISHTQYEFASILKFVEDNWNLGRMGVAGFPNNDARAVSIAACSGSNSCMFDFTIKPRKFQSIPSKLKKEHFLHEKPSFEQLDDTDD